MKATARDLRFRSKELLDTVRRGEEVLITSMELVQGMRNRRKLAALRRALRDWKAEILHISEEISVRAMFLVERHFLSDSRRLADALIASTALTKGIPVFTANDQHYKAVNHLAAALIQSDPFHRNL